MTMTEVSWIDISTLEVDFSSADQVWASYSSLGKHRSCPQAWHYGALRHLERADYDPKVELNLGLWWHAVLAAESINRGRRLGTLQKVPDQLRVVDDEDGHSVKIDTTASPLVQTVLEAAGRWWNKQSETTRALWDERLGEGLTDRLDYMFESWLDANATEREVEEPLAVELGWRRELPMPPGYPKVMLVGYVDEVYRDTKRNVVVCRDHKAQRALGSQSVADDMMDSQLQLYAWGASPEVTSWGVGKISAIGYDRARMVKPKTPVVTQAGSLSKQVTDFDARTYQAWCEAGPAYPGRFKDGSGAGVYQLEQPVLDKLLTPAARAVWHQRTLAPLNVNLVRAHMQAAVDSAIDMMRTKQRWEDTGAAQRNLGSACRWCDFAKLCRAEMVGGPDGEYVLADMGLRERAR